MRYPHGISPHHEKIEVMGVCAKWGPGGYGSMPTMGLPSCLQGIVTWREEWSPHLMLIPGPGTVHESTWWYKLQTAPAVHRETVGSYLPQGLGEG